MTIKAANASAKAVKPVLRKRTKDKTPVDQETKLLLAEDRRRNYLFEKVRPASRQNKRVDAVKTRVQVYNHFNWLIPCFNPLSSTDRIISQIVFLLIMPTIYCNNYAIWQFF